MTAEERKSFFAPSLDATDVDLRAGRGGRGDGEDGGGARGEGSPTRLRLRRSGDDLMLLLFTAAATAVDATVGGVACCRCSLEVWLLLL